jgi:thiol-disulfide isomerase/thioredoxin
MRILPLLLLLFFSGLPVVVLADDLLIFGADWCPRCQELKAAIAADPALVDGYAVSFLDLDDNPELAKGYKIDVVPALLHLQPDGKIRRKVGFKNPAELKRWLKGQNEQPTKFRKFMRQRMD